MVFDCNVWHGFDGTQQIDMRPERVCEILKEKKIDRALITNTRCKHGDALLGNDETRQAIARNPAQLTGMIGVSLTQYLDVEKSVRKYLFDPLFLGVHFFNTDDSFMAGWGNSLNNLGMRSVLRLIEKRAMPVYLEGGYAFADIAQVCAEHPNIPFIAGGVGYVNLSEAILALQQRKNLYLDISTIDGFEAIHLLVDHASAEQLLFGTGLPYNCPSCARIMVETATVSREDKAAILGGNLMKLLESRRLVC